ncbi:D-tagatose-1,6-bisphosphate aldolase subunit [Raphidocelis subcapitata]|uniref:D-tagatose-1,6-bisphosphate aldolase subunit n=1 Tax=Raphidocelis subcapitata TaxID=307507 RepID=A0A2V0P4B0_9CHLO|nr:D-tagatose-1,6-bisphosphate aldolase subunit [Raphidocelis subcapitata]|eukprot:GBF94704.1 D-tagatose-1,6-bisphosphate aldolase subunit [Raphidocelis subcapitata]
MPLSPSDSAGDLRPASAVPRLSRASRGSRPTFRRAFFRDALGPLQPEESNTVQEIITIFTAEGTVHRLPGRRISIDPSDAAGRAAGGWRGRQQPMPTWEEQTLCIGASFAVSATNGRDPTRRVNFLGFCQSVDYLQESIEDTVLSRGGEVLLQERQVRSGVHEVLRLTVCVPFLWGVPPELDALSNAIVQGGGILDKVSKRWDIYAPGPAFAAGPAACAAHRPHPGGGGTGGTLF